MAIAQGPQLQGWELGAIKRLVSDQVRRLGPAFNQDFDDLFQECLLRWITVRERWKGLDDSQRRRILGSVVQNRLNDIVRCACAQKRGGGLHCLSLDQPVSDDEHAETLADVLAEIGGDGLRHGGGLDAVEWRIDLSRVIGRLTRTQQRVLELSIEGELSGREVARDLDIPVWEVYKHLRAIRRVLIQVGLTDDLLSDDDIAPRKSV